MPKVDVGDMALEIDPFFVIVCWQKFAAVLKNNIWHENSFIHLNSSKQEQIVSINIHRHLLNDYEDQATMWVKSHSQHSCQLTKRGAHKSVDLCESGRWKMNYMDNMLFPEQ